MPGYRYRFLNEAGEVHGGLDVDCEHDDHELAGAAELEHAHGMEVWQGERLVGSVPAVS
jgi:hypothetical protein